MQHTVNTHSPHTNTQSSHRVNTQSTHKHSQHANTVNMQHTVNTHSQHANTINMLTQSTRKYSQLPKHTVNMQHTVNKHSQHANTVNTQSTCKHSQHANTQSTQPSKHTNTRFKLFFFQPSIYFLTAEQMSPNTFFVNFTQMHIYEP